MEKNYNELLSKVDERVLKNTEEVANSILELIGDVLENANGKSGVISSVSKYNNLGNITTRKSSFIEDSSYSINEKGLVIRLNYSKIINKYQSDLEKSETYIHFNSDVNSFGVFDDSNIDYKYLNEILSKNNISVKRLRKSRALKYSTLEKDELVVTLSREKVLREKITKEVKKEEPKEENVSSVKKEIFEKIKKSAKAITDIDFSESAKQSFRNIKNKIDEAFSFTDKTEEKKGTPLSKLVDRLNIDEKTKTLLKSFMTPNLMASFDENSSLEDITNYMCNILGVLPLDKKTEEDIRTKLKNSIKSKKYNSISDFIDGLNIDDANKSIIKWWVSNVNIPENLNEDSIKDYISELIDKLPLNSETKDFIKQYLESDGPKLKK